ncbi:hypothetical protein BDP27DRAFT_1426785 [Rhodocollybia butyracea]|uniref:Uncharacterized protein n=1 Tax=Rhodocollybia butyracea TaxID=206335 RepID=A0A9P5PGN2_9AGAR|nr:hypothetical protein BDP27DRAFT_1426785 [Rhodocollybia butyracea]
MNSQPLFQFVLNTAPVAPDPSALQQSISQPMTFGTDPVLVPKTRRQKQKPAVFKVPDYPIQSFATESQSPAGCSSFLQSPSLTPIVGLGLAEPFLENGTDTQSPLASSLFSSFDTPDSSSYFTSTNTRSFHQLPATLATPALLSSWSEPSRDVHESKSSQVLAGKIRGKTRKYVTRGSQDPFPTGQAQVTSQTFAIFG